MKNYLAKIVMVLVLGTMLFACETDQVVTPDDRLTPIVTNLLGQWDWESTEYDRGTTTGVFYTCDQFVAPFVENDRDRHRAVEFNFKSKEDVTVYEICNDSDNDPTTQTYQNMTFEVDENTILFYGSGASALYRYEILQSNFTTPVKRMTLQLTYSWTDDSLVGAIYNLTK